MVLTELLRATLQPGDRSLTGRSGPRRGRSGGGRRSPGEPEADLRGPAATARSRASGLCPPPQNFSTTFGHNNQRPAAAAVSVTG